MGQPNEEEAEVAVGASTQVASGVGRDTIAGGASPDAYQSDSVSLKS